MKQVLIIQSSLRGFFFNFGRHLKTFEFVKVAKTGPDPRTQSLPSFDREINRTKTGWFAKFRRAIGLLNIRPFFTRTGDLVFTYGCVLLTNKPYCVCMENGLAIFNYDPVLARHPFARLALSLCLLDPHFTKLIFLSQAAKASFFSSVKLPQVVMRMAASKAEVCYPITGRQSPVLWQKKSSAKVRFLFAGFFYMKGGIELIKTVIKLNKTLQEKFELTVVTQLKLMLGRDIAWVKSLPNVHLQEANLTSDQMNRLYCQSDVFIYPTYRDSFGLVLLEAISWGLPAICTGQFAISEMVLDQKTGFVLAHHPMQDYDLRTYEIFGKYYQPQVFYRDLFRFQSQGKFRPVEDFLYISMKKMIDSPELLARLQKNTHDLYRSKFDYLLSAQKIEQVFTQAVSSLE